MTASTYFLSKDFPTCTFQDCERQAQKRSGLCIAHRSQQKAGKDLTPLAMTRAEIMARFGGVCRLDICEEEVWVKGYCKYHYQQHRSGREFKVRPEKAARSKPCTFPGCDRLQHSKGHCSTHAKQRREGLELTPLPVRSTIPECSFPGCNLEKRSKGLCAAHYGQSRRGTGELSNLRDYFTPDEPCKVECCESPALREGYCKGHTHQVRRYNLSAEQVIELITPNVCAICGAGPDSRKLHIDHDHSCCPGRNSCGQCVRGVLCADCNLSLGKMGDSPERLRKAAEYLEGGVK